MFLLINDFRFYKEYTTPKGWPPDDLEEYKHYIKKKPLKK